MKKKIFILTFFATVFMTLLFTTDVYAEGTWNVSNLQVNGSELAYSSYDGSSTVRAVVEEERENGVGGPTGNAYLDAVILLERLSDDC